MLDRQVGLHHAQEFLAVGSLWALPLTVIQAQTLIDRLEDFEDYDDEIYEDLIAGHKAIQRARRGASGSGWGRYVAKRQAKAIAQGVDAILPSTQTVRRWRRVGQLLVHLPECYLLTHTPQDVADCLDRTGEFEGVIVHSAAQVFKRYEGLIFERGERGYRIFQEPDRRRARRVRQLRGHLATEMPLGGWTSLTFTTHADRDLSRLGLSDPSWSLENRPGIVDVSKVLCDGRPWFVLAVPEPNGPNGKTAQWAGSDYCLWPARSLQDWHSQRDPPEATDRELLLLTQCRPDVYSTVTMIMNVVDQWVPEPDYLMLRWTLLDAAQRQALGIARSPRTWGSSTRGEALTHCLAPSCGNPLTTPESVARGYGPVCWERLTGQARSVGYRGAPIWWGAPDRKPWRDQLLARLGPYLLSSGQRLPVEETPVARYQRR